MEDLRGKTIRGGLVRVAAQGANFLLRLVTLMILARLLVPSDFGLVGMVTAFTGVLALFRDFGLSAATIQRATVTEEQISALFWVNLLIGVILGVTALVLSPFIAAIYHEPRLIGITAALALGLVFNSAGIQHGSLLQREMRFTALAVMNVASLITAGGVAILAALVGLGYWALVVMAIVLPLCTSVGSWIMSRWTPGRPRRGAGILSMLRFGGTVTMNSLVVYVANNFDKVLVGRYCGVEALGIYGRAYQLVSIPIDNLNSAAGEVAFSALSRIQQDAERHKRYFLKGYALLLAITVPIAIACALLADDLIAVLLGPNWTEAAPVFRLLAPTILAFAIVNPLGWLIYSMGLVGRGLKMALAIAPVMLVAYVLGLPYGPRGVAFAYSAVTMLWIVPAIAWAVHGTMLSVKDVLVTVIRPLAAGVAAGVLTVGVGQYCRELLPFARLVVQGSLLCLSYALLLVFGTGQKAFYLETIRDLRR